MILLLLSCTSYKLDDSSLDLYEPPTVQECPASNVINVEIRGAIVGLSVETPSGALVAPHIQILTEEIIVTCPEEGGVLTVVWG